MSSIDLSRFKSIIDSNLVKKILLGVGVAAGVLTAIYLYKYRNKAKEPRLYPKYPLSAQKKFEEKLKLNPPDVVILHKVPRGRKVPCISTHPFKLETFLRFNNINYIVSFDGIEPKTFSTSETISLGLEDVTDSEKCIASMCYKFTLPENDDKFLCNSDCFECFKILEEKLHWSVLIWRWNFIGEGKIREIQYFPQEFDSEIIKQTRESISDASLFKCPAKKKDRQNVIEQILTDLARLSEKLGSKKYFLGDDKPTLLDASAFAILSQIIWNTDEKEFKNSVVKGFSNEFKNLHDFCLRIRKDFWPDWDLCLLNEPPE